jgi:hypothetical protein
VLIQRNWLRLDPSRHRLNRVLSLQPLLDGGRYELAAHDWIVVHEAFIAHPSLERLRLAEAIAVDASFGGNQGPDFRIFEAPPATTPEGVLEVGFGEGGGRDYLGHEWPPRIPGEDDRLLPAEGARLFLPPLGGKPRRLELATRAASPGERAEIDLYAGERRLERLTAGDGGTQGSLPPMATAVGDTVAAFELLPAVVGPEVVELFMQPAAGSGAVRVVGFRLQ